MTKTNGFSITPAKAEVQRPVAAASRGTIRHPREGGGPEIGNRVFEQPVSYFCGNLPSLPRRGRGWLKISDFPYEFNPLQLPLGKGESRKGLSATDTSYFCGKPPLLAKERPRVFEDSKFSSLIQPPSPPSS